MKKLAVLFLLTLYVSFSFACSTFLLSKDGHHVFGRNYDWVSGNGMVMVNARGLKKTSFSPPGAEKVSWLSRWGSITFNQYGKEFPHGGMNEAGLVVELMWLTETTYPAADGRAGVNELQWIQYQLDNCATVEDVIATDQLLRIDRMGAAPLHYLVADARGNAATIEFIKGKMVVHRGKDLPYPVLTNTVYSDALRRVENGKALAVASFTDNSLDRFATACRMVQQFKEAKNVQKPIDYAFDILDKVAQGPYTKWRIVYDITDRKIFFTTSDNTQRRYFAFSDFDFACNRPSLAFHLSDRKGGAVAPFFAPLDYTTNKTLIQKTAQESRSAIRIPAELINSASGYFQEVKCEKR